MWALGDMVGEDRPSVGEYLLKHSPDLEASPRAHDPLQPDDIVPGDVHVSTPAIVASRRVSRCAVGELDLS